MHYLPSAMDPVQCKTLFFPGATITSARSTVIAAEVVVSVINFRSAVYQLLQTEQAEQTRI